MVDPAAETESLVYTPPSYIEPLPIREMFAVAQPLEVELGAGDGSFIAAYAAAHREHNFLAVERLLGRLRKIEKKGRRAGLRNLRLLRLEAGYLTQYLLPPASIEVFHIYFPDPWPKRRHWKNRLITEEFTQLLERALKPGGMVYLRTDNSDYFEQMLRSFAVNQRFDKGKTPPQLLEFGTDFEREFHKRGIPTLHSCYRKQL